MLGYTLERVLIMSYCDIWLSWWHVIHVYYIQKSEFDIIKLLLISKIVKAEWYLTLNNGRRPRKNLKF